MERRGPGRIGYIRPCAVVEEEFGDSDVAVSNSNVEGGFAAGVVADVEVGGETAGEEELD